MNKLRAPRKKLNLEIAMALGLVFTSSSVFAQWSPCTASGDTVNCGAGGTWLTPVYSVTEGDLFSGNASLGHKLNGNYKHLVIDTVGRMQPAGPKGIGLYINGTTGTLLFDTVSIKTNGPSADVIRTNAQSTLTINGVLTAIAAGSSGDGINAANSNNSASTVIVASDRAYIESKGGIGVRANTTATARGNEISIANNATIITRGTGSNTSSGQGYAVYAGDRDSDTVNLPLAGTARVFIGNDSTIQTSGNNAHAVYANKTGVIELGSTNIQTAGSKAHGIVAQDGTVRYTATNVTQAYTGGQVYLKGDTAITVDPTKNSYAMYSSGENSLITSSDRNGVQKSGEYKVTGNLVADRQGKIDIRAINASEFKGDLLADGVNSSITVNLADTSRYHGNIATTDNASVNVTLNNNAYFEGSSRTLTDGRIAMTINGNNAVWQVPTSSDLTELNLVNGGQVILGDMATRADSTNRVVLDIQDLSGNGKFHVRADIARDGAVKPVFLPNEGDVIRILGTAQGTHQIFVRDANLGSAAVGTDGSEILRIVETLSDGATFTLAPEQPYVDVGPYQYILDKEDNILAAQAGASRAAFGPRATWTYWSLGAVPTVTTPGGSGGTGAGKTPPPLTNAAKGSVNILNANYLLGYIENQTLLQRMGELRTGGEGKSDVWGRVYGGKLNSFGDRRLSGFDMSYSGMQMGVDRQLASEKGMVRIGVMGGYTKGNANYVVGDGSATSYHAGVYGTYKAENGFYVDAIAKYGRMTNKFSTLTGGGYPVHGNGKTKGYSIGIEVGKRFYIQKPDQGWYIEPQAQITHTHQGSATVISSNGLRTDLDSYNSTIGRVSVIGGYSITEGKNPINVYFMTGLVKEFAGKTGYTFNYRARENFDFGGTWWENRIGVNAQFKERHNIYIDATYSKGSRFNQQQINLGYRYQF